MCFCPNKWIGFTKYNRLSQIKKEKNISKNPTSDVPYCFDQDLKKTFNEKLILKASFATYVLIDPINNILDSQTAFVSLTLFNTMRGPLFLLPFGIVSIIQGMVSIGRVNSFLNLEEINPDNVSRYSQLFVYARVIIFIWLHKKNFT